ncbi:MAG TPA: BON domain-containing protein [Vicinamibacterales bacterium]|nr:BON domain-containing protein [Vicinamibacterales bacterium]
MRLSHMFVAALLVGVPVGSASAAVPQSAEASKGDKAIEDRIEKRIARDSSLKDFSIKVDVAGGVATLSGTVATEADRGKVGAIAKLSGASRVENRIVADLEKAGNTKGTTGKVEQKTGEAVDKTKEGAGKVVDATKGAAGKTAEYATDAWITSRVKTKFIGEDLLKDSDVHVSTDNHVVTLTGHVMSGAGRAKAVEIAKSIEGVHRVVNKIAVGR